MWFGLKYAVYCLFLFMCTTLGTSITLEAGKWEVHSERRVVSRCVINDIGAQRRERMSGWKVKVAFTETWGERLCWVGIYITSVTHIVTSG